MKVHLALCHHHRVRGTDLITTGPTSGFGSPMAGEGMERRRVVEAAPIKLSLLEKDDGWTGLALSDSQPPSCPCCTRVDVALRLGGNCWDWSLEVSRMLPSRASDAGKCRLSDGICTPGISARLLLQHLSAEALECGVHSQYGQSLYIKSCWFHSVLRSTCQSPLIDGHSLVHT